MDIIDRINEALNEEKTLWDVYFKRDGKYKSWGKKPMTKNEAEDLMDEVIKAKIPSVDNKSGIIVKAGTKPPKG